MNYTTLKTEVLIALRDNHTQLEMGQKLGYSFNQYHKWETNLKWLRWDEFIDILEVCQIPVKEVFAGVLTFQGDPRKFSELISTICANLSPKEIAQGINQTEDVVRRWLKKDICPSAETIFQLIQWRTNNLSEFLGHFVDINRIPSLVGLYDQQHIYKTLSVKFAFSGALVAALCLEQYQNLPEHSNAWLSQRILVSEELIAEALMALLAAGTIIKKNDKYIQQNGWVQMNGLAIEESSKVDRYWTERALDRYCGPTGVPWTPKSEKITNIRSFRVAPMSEEAALAIQSELRKTSQAILNILHNDKDVQTKIGVYVNHFFDVEDIHWKETK
jgi:hypothetical protein